MRSTLLALLLALLVVASLFLVCLIVAGIIAVFAAIIIWSLQSKRDTRSYRASPATAGVPWQCALCGRRFPNRQAALAHAEPDHPERDAAEVREHLSIASGMAPPDR